ncbi:MAG: type II secretion system protein [Phycisphaerae bacterium]
MALAAPLTNTPPCPIPRWPRRGGFTALETLLAAGILAIVAAAVSGALSAGRMQSRNAQDTVHASMLARALMDEIIRLPYTDPHGYTSLGPDPGENNRTQYDNIKDYHGYTDGPSNVNDPAGNVYPSELQGYTRSVVMTPTSLSPPGWPMGPTGLLITVTVQKNGTTLATLQRMAVP